MSRYDEVMAQIMNDYKQTVEGVLSNNGEEILMSDSVRKTESPIERLIYIQIKHEIIILGESGGRPPRLVPQYEMKMGDRRIRVDFLLTVYDSTDESNKIDIVIECDGHDYHEKTKEQARRDKSRDRFLLNQGYYVMRFTGSEIYKSPKKCVTEIDSLIMEKLYGDEIRSSLLV